MLWSRVNRTINLPEPSGEIGVVPAVKHIIHNCLYAFQFSSSIYQLLMYWQDC